MEEIKRGDCICFINPSTKEGFLGFYVYKYTNDTHCVMDAQTDTFYVIFREQMRLCGDDEIDVIKEEWNAQFKLPHSKPINMCKF